MPSSRPSPASTPSPLADPDTSPTLDALAEAIRRSRAHPTTRQLLPSHEDLRAGFTRLHPMCPWPRTFVHTPETNPQPTRGPLNWGDRPHSTDPAVLFRHSGWARPRRLVRQALVDLDIGLRPLERFDRCGADPWVVVDESDPTRLAIHSDHCHNRWCTPCSRQRAARIVGNLKQRLNDGHIRFLTLTMKHSDTPLSHQIDRIYQSFRKLRRADFWTSAVDGGCAVLELKHSHQTRLWHVHIHCLLDGRYVDQADIKAEWWRITGDSHVVDIKHCHDADHAAHYVVKYITKPVPSSVINKPDQLREMIAALARRRLVLTWGTWRGVRLSAPLDTTTWQLVASLPELYRRRDAGNLDAYAILVALEQMLPELPIVAGRDPPAHPDDPIGLLF